jgi:hypothetical protein
MGNTTTYIINYDGNDSIPCVEHSFNPIIPFNYLDNYDELNMKNKYFIYSRIMSRMLPKVTFDYEFYSKVFKDDNVLYKHKIKGQITYTPRSLKELKFMSNALDHRNSMKKNFDINCIPNDVVWLYYHNEILHKLPNGKTSYSDFLICNSRKYYN